MDRSNDSADQPPPKLFLDLQIASNEKNLPTQQQLENWVSLTLEQQNCNNSETELTIRIVDEAEIRTLNNDYRGKNYPTNVLSFPADLPEELDIPLLGDLVICAPVIAREAHEQHKTADAHWAHMVIHGTLHLLGYDHIDDAEAEIMEDIEIQLLKQLGHPDPYQDDPNQETESNN